MSDTLSSATTASSKSRRSIVFESIMGTSSAVKAITKEKDNIVSNLNETNIKLLLANNDIGNLRQTISELKAEKKTIIDETTTTIAALKRDLDEARRAATVIIDSYNALEINAKDLRTIIQKIEDENRQLSEKVTILQNTINLRKTWIHRFADWWFRIDIPFI